MKELTIISGKGGAGKTSITAALAALASGPILADCDVDASDLHLLMQPEVREKRPFISGHEATVRADDCVYCGACLAYCRFGAVYEDRDHDTFRINPVLCEGCGVCVHFCPAKAIDFPEAECGEWYISDTRYGKMVHARLNPGAENSGKLVSEVRQQAKHEAQESGAEWVLVDGPPGIGCPVIASATGADAILLVTEPTISGKHDMERVLDLAKHFRTRAFVVVNKWDINEAMTDEIEKAASEKGAELAGRVPYDKAFTEAQIAGMNILEYNNNPAAKEIKEIWEKVCKAME